MKKRFKTSGSNQLWWVMLLLGVAVILPTVCLLWFMTQAVKNERLAVRQKLLDVYSNKATSAFVKDTDRYSPFFIKDIEKAYQDKKFRDDPYLFFLLFGARPHSRSQGMIIYGKDGRPICPIFQNAAGQTDDLFIEPFQLELENDFQKAIEEYSVLAEKTESEQIRYQSLVARARCFYKMGRSKEAIEILKELSNPKEVKPELAGIIQHCKVFLAELYLKTKDENLQEYLVKNLNSGKWVEPAETTIWQLGKMISITDQAGLTEKLSQDIELANARIQANKNALKAHEMFATSERLSDWPERAIRKWSAQNDLYVMHFRLGDLTFLRIFTEDKAFEKIKKAASDFQDDTVGMKVLDNYGKVIAGDASLKDKPFLRLHPGEFLPEFMALFYFRDDSVFDSAADRQTSVYRWIGMLVVVLIMISGAAACQVIGRQIKLNKLKNDFIATVTHELKTPLASMRVLVDTLLEGRYEDEKQVMEYLQLVSKENRRLSGLIDKFLTFSRMERNKQIFDMEKISPADIAKVAAEAVGTKFKNCKNGSCDFTLNLADDLPSIMADKDAMVTVLVNLLDNAYKYSGEQKRIELNVSHEDNTVCFSVRDNGIGLSRKAQKKIFNKFYQVDSSLSRTTEGCGLGLSIVKFIVDVHKGSLTVNSKTGLGSFFKVFLKFF